ncbi:hypothetical protein HNY73_016872 [Argiope bruennichi]|uniref:C2H2-type domain-containing protein n=1 Tax=Argiope bruennichi TaxID=94029 RepID=A0A8T0EK92_ARGBR|nr:hypothetical protein HNY73_016872 [Argiope bruennichi]
MGKEKEKAVCCHCEKQFTTTSNMYQHIREVHGVEPANFGRLKCPGCRNNFPNYESIRNHITRVHNVKCDLEEHRFPTEKDFFEWKYKVEEEKKCLYVRHSAPRIAANKESVYYYICHRSGHHKSRSTGKRPSKLESNKIDAHCPSTMMVKVSKKRVYVLFCPIHYGHEATVGRERRHPKDPSSSDKKAKDDKINEGSKSSLQKTLDGVQHGTEESEHLQALIKKDVQNIKKDFAARSSEENHENEIASIRWWVQSVSQLEDNPIIFYKDQGAADMTGFLSDEDFCLIIMTKFQLKMLTDFCNPKICIDTVHGANANDYYLTTMLTVDEFDVGCPVAFCICNRTNIEVINFFFNYIRSKAGVISTTVFMSDDAPEFYNAWEVVMGASQYQLLCPWLVDRNWRKNLSKINPRIKKITVYKTLRVLLQEPNLESFMEMEKNFVKLLEDDPDTRKFKKYYSTYYAQRVQLWAFCYRKHLGINTNIYLEAFHKVLTHVYLEGKRVKRIDKTLDALLKLSKDKIFERMCNIARKIPSSSETNVQNHLQSILITDEMITPIIEDQEWKVKSSHEIPSTYTVRKCLKPVCRSCKCSPLHPNSNICIHEYECSCYDNVIKFNICEHIQACLRVIESKKKQPVATQCRVIVINAQALKQQNTNSNSDVEIAFNKKLMLLKELSNSVKTRNTYLQANTLLDKCIALFKEAKDLNSTVDSNVKNAVTVSES